MKVTLTRPAGGHDKGDTIDVLDSVAERLIARGAATAEAADAPSGGPKRARRSKTTTETSEAAQEGGGASPSPLP